MKKIIVLFLAVFSLRLTAVNIDMKIYNHYNKPMNVYLYGPNIHGGQRAIWAIKTTDKKVTVPAHGTSTIKNIPHEGFDTIVLWREADSTLDSNIWKARVSQAPLPGTSEFTIREEGKGLYNWKPVLASRETKLHANYISAEDMI